MKSLTVMVVISAVVACGGGGSGRSGVDPDRSLGELDVGELEQVCRAAVYDDYGLDSARLLRWNCYVTAITLHRAAPLLFDCVSLASDCIAAGPSLPGEQDACSFESPTPDLGSCADVTVRQIDACLAALHARAQDLVDTVSCATTADSITIPPADCTTVASVCPDLFGK